MTSSISISGKEPIITASSSSPLLTLPAMANDIERVNEELRNSVQSDDSFLTEVAIHLINAGGKRVRPALSITTSLISENEPVSVDHDVIRGGVAVELVRTQILDQEQDKNQISYLPQMQNSVLVYD